MLKHLVTNSEIIELTFHLTKTKAFFKKHKDCLAKRKVTHFWNNVR